MSEPVAEAQEPDPPPAVPSKHDVAAASLQVDSSALSTEEQMAKFEEALKESDWGHQPC